MKRMFLMLCLVFFVSGCTTSAKFNIPPNSNLYLNERAEPTTVRPNGVVRTLPFGWGAIAGIPFKLEKDGQVINQGQLKAHFRIASIFWPPLALIYSPVNFGQWDYDLTNVSQGIDHSKASDAPANSTSQKLRELQKLRDDGLITEAEYQQKKKDILAQFK